MYSHLCYHVVLLDSSLRRVLLLVLVIPIVVGGVQSWFMVFFFVVVVVVVRRHPLATILRFLLLSRCIVVLRCFALFCVVLRCFTLLLFLLLSMWLLCSFFVSFTAPNIFYVFLDPRDSIVSFFNIYIYRSLPAQFHLSVLSRSYVALSRRSKSRYI